MDIKPFRTAGDHAAALKEIEALMGATANTPEGDKLDALVTLVAAWEQKYLPMDLPNPRSGTTFDAFLEEQGMYDEVTTKAQQRALAESAGSPEWKIPNQETIAAMNESRAMMAARQVRFDNADKLFASLEKD